MTNLEYKKRFDKIYNSFVEAHMYFYTWKGLQKINNEKIWNSNPNFWNAVLLSMHRSFLQMVANIYEGAKTNHKEVISVYYLIENKKINRKKQLKLLKMLMPYRQVIKNIVKIRNKELSHHDAKFMLNRTKFYKKYSVKYAEVEGLFKKTELILHLLHPQHHSFSISGFDEHCEYDSNEIMKKLQYFKKQEEKNMKKYMAGKTQKHSLV